MPWLEYIFLTLVVTLHVSVWVEIWPLPQRLLNRCHAPRERVSWNVIPYHWVFCFGGHAPRERVSWNYLYAPVNCKVLGHAPRERVSWNCYDTEKISNATMSRSTWACELKFPVWPLLSEYSSHAPRERVSWNCKFAILSWYLAVTLHVSVWVEIVVMIERKICGSSHAPRERVSWNVKGLSWPHGRTGHAPRERVSWN